MASRTQSVPKGVLFAFQKITLTKKIDFVKWKNTLALSRPQVKVNFMMVGHTHDDIDQMFSRFSAKLHNKNAVTISQLSTVCHNGYTPNPVVEVVEEVLDWIKYIAPTKKDTSWPLQTAPI